MLPTCLMAQEKIGNKIYKYGSINSSVNGTTLISFDEAQAKTMSKTLQYFSKAGVDSRSWNSIFLPGTEVSESDFSKMLDDSNIQTLIFIDITDSEMAQANRTTTSAYASANRKYKSSSNGNSYNSKSSNTFSGGAISTSRTTDYTTDLSLRMTIFSKEDGFSKPLGVVEGRATNESPDATADQLARRIIRRMVKALEDQNAF